MTAEELQVQIETLLTQLRDLEQQLGAAQTPKESKVILDTCILQYLNDPNLEPELTRIFRLLERQGNKFYFSDFSTYELFSCCPRSKEKRLSAIWKNFSRFTVDPKVVRFAAELATAYNVVKLPITSISDGDKIIGATAILTDSVVFTANGNDFPRPFFEERRTEDIPYKTKGGKLGMIKFYFLAPNPKIVSFYFEGRP